MHLQQVLCTGTYYEARANGTFSPAVDFIVRYVPMEIHQLDLHTLKPNCSYSCTVQAEGIGAGYPCHFITNAHKSHVSHVGSIRDAKLSQFRAGYKNMMGSILLGGVLPMLLIASCVGAIYLAKKYQIFQQKADNLTKYQRYIMHSDCTCIFISFYCLQNNGIGTIWGTSG